MYTAFLPRPSRRNIAAPTGSISFVVTVRVKLMASGRLGRSFAAPASGRVRPSLVAEGEHCRRPALLLDGICAAATVELYGPTTAMTSASLMILAMASLPVDVFALSS